MALVTLSDQIDGQPGGGFPARNLVNLYYHPTPGGPFKDARLPRPGLSLSATRGTGPVRGIFQRSGVFGGDVFVVSGRSLYRGATLIGVVASDSGPARFDASAEQLVVVSAGKAYLYEGGSLSQISDADLPEVSDVVFVAGRFLYSVKNSDRMYHSAVNDAANIDGLAFETAEGSPDVNVATALLDDEIVIFGAGTVEVWFATGDNDAPYQRVQNRRFGRGCASQASVVGLDNTIYWVGNGEEGRQVFRVGQVPIAIPNPVVDAALAACAEPADIWAFSTAFNGHLFYVLNIPAQGTFAYDVTTKRWSEWRSYGHETFRARCAVMVDGTPYLGDAATGKVWTLSASARTDAGDPIARIVSAFVPLASGTVKASSVLLECVRGVGTATGEAAEPLVEMRYSDDLRTWTEWFSAPLGAQGDYIALAIWWRLGLMTPPGRMYEFRSDEPVLQGYQAVRLNEPVR